MSMKLILYRHTSSPLSITRLGSYLAGRPLAPFAPGIPLYPGGPLKPSIPKGPASP